MDVSEGTEDVLPGERPDPLKTPPPVEEGLTENQLEQHDHLMTVDEQLNGEFTFILM